ncbi:homeodomain-interacting protein kinase 1-like [Gymnodraco acuticeps]|uniref:Homeodomain-interacting protein kinase 1-like n=1 Tax=Gymnodraco acuticeps TaxID=8218 RepID=A0A6P8TR51_GYMAC|nr:homeodomain-interacting protein kinase 1-like [Gymnodraco acuticeps]
MPSVLKSQPLVSTISDNYEILIVLGVGSFGQVLKCLKLDTAETVAVKVLRNSNADELNMREMCMLKKLRCFDSDKSNIVRCHECFQRMDRTFMVFEMLDMSLHEYMDKREWLPAPLNGIRTVIKDLATAFDALKSIGLIHTDLKLDNVMLVDHQVHPFRVKLIDFGLVVKTSEVWKGLVVQPLWHRAPDVILGQLFNAAIDVWSLGTILAVMLLGVQLFPGNNQYDVLHFIIDLLGEPPRKLLNSGLFTESFFKGKSRFCGQTVWKFKTPLEFQLETKLKTSDDREYTFSSLEELKTSSTHNKTSFQAEDGNSCVELLQDMLQMDQKKRITPKQILAHPFITRSYLNLSKNCLYGTETVEADSSSERPGTEQTKLDGSSEHSCSLKELPAGVIEVQTDERTVLVEEATKESSVLRTQTVHGDTPSSVKAEIAPEIKLESVTDEDWEISISVIGKGHSEAPKSSSEEPLPAPVVSEPRKKKKKGIRGFFSRMRRNFFSCFCVPGQGEE